jgi:hypothetical protein
MARVWYFGWRYAAARVASATITRRTIVYWLVAMAALLVVGTIVGLLWADTSNVAGAIAVVTNIVGGAGVLFFLVALAVVIVRQRKAV